MKSVKEGGLHEITSLKNRVARTFAMGRIHREDMDNLIEMCEEIEDYIAGMEEGDDGQTQAHQAAGG